MLFYMLNDESDDVRILAINAIKSSYDPFQINVLIKSNIRNPTSISSSSI
jgi:hypothetical protein